MRLKLSEILSTIDQFNGTGEYSEQYEGGEVVDINTDLPDEPKQAKGSEGVEKNYNGHVKREQYQRYWQNKYY